MWLSMNEFINGFQSTQDVGKGPEGVLSSMNEMNFKQMDFF